MRGMQMAQWMIAWEGMWNHYYNANYLHKGIFAWATLCFIMLLSSEGSGGHRYRLCHIVMNVLSRQFQSWAFTGQITPYLLMNDSYVPWPVTTLPNHYHVISLADMKRHSLLYSVSFHPKCAFCECRKQQWFSSAQGCSPRPWITR